MKHELLAPAGSPEICRAVIAAGADAVYLGGEKYGARAFAQNFSEHDVLEALDFAHLYGRKIFLTVNTLLKNREMGAELYQYLIPYYKHGLDAIIVQDYGVFQYVRKYFPELPVHISTQMSVSNVYGAEFLKKQGASRIVTARELSLKEIKSIYDQTGIEIESFVHGALCYCYSGQCLMSSMLGGRSGNRGRCAQPCRLSYQVLDNRGKVLHKKEKYPLSPKDLCALDLLPQLCNAGIYSFKIEGRMKSLEYAAGVTQIYRKYLDLYENSLGEFSVDDRDYQYLLDLGNRNGFTRGYYEMRNGRSMMTLTESSHNSGSAKMVFSSSEKDRIPIRGFVKLKIDEPMIFELSFNQTENISVFGETVQKAQNKPLTKEDVERRLSRTGDTAFVFEKLQVEIEDSCFVPVGKINELRRDALEALQKKILSDFQRTAENMYDKSREIRGETFPKEEKQSYNKETLNVLVSNLQQLEEVLKYPFVHMISLDISAENRLFFDNGKISLQKFLDVLESCRRRITDAGKQSAFCFPYIFRQNSSDFYEKESVSELLNQFDRIWVRSYDSLAFALNRIGISPGKVGLDYNLYVFSEDSLEAFLKSGICHYTISPELNQKELMHMPNEMGEMSVYGYLPLMVSAQCVYNNYAQCYKRHPEEKHLCLKDRYYKNFVIKRNCKDCYNLIYNSQPLYLLHQADAVKALGFGSHRISFVSEKTDQIQKILKSYQEAFLGDRKIQPPTQKDSFTNGHFKRGVE